jgi:hypothetical protein
MVRRKETALQKADRLFEESMRLKTRGHMTAITAALKKYPAQVSPVYDDLKRRLSRDGIDLDKYLNVLPGEQVVDELHQVVLPPPGVAHGRGAKRAICDVGIDGEVDGPAPASSAPGSSSMAQNTLQPLEDATCSQLMKLLSLIEKALFSAAGMKTLCKPLQRNPAKPSLLEMVEFCTNRGRRSLVNLNELEDEGKRMADMNVHHGRRAMSISMPPDWKNEGIYSIVTLSGGSIVKIVQRCSNGQRVVPADILEGHDAKHLYIADNFSEEEALLCSRGGFLQFKISLLFGQSRMAASRGSSRGSGISQSSGRSAATRLSAVEELDRAAASDVLDHDVDDENLDQDIAIPAVPLLAAPRSEVDVVPPLPADIAAPAVLAGADDELDA